MTDSKQDKPPFLLFVAAEPSGDQHAGHVVRALREKRPELAFGAFGGEDLRASGCELYEDLMGSASMVLGFSRSLLRYYRLLRRFDRLLVEKEPAAVVLVDSPGLNFLLARLARWRGIPVVYYICPQIWAWAPWRLSKVRRWTDLLMTILPFEEELYRGGRVPVEFVGHPLPDELRRYSPAVGQELRAGLGMSSSQRLVGMFPGSRRQEVEGLTETFCSLIQRWSPDAGTTRVAVSCYRDEFRPLILGAGRKHGIDLCVVSDDARRLMVACDVAIVASGTASLELAYFEKPMVVLYRTSRLGRLLFQYFRVTPWIALPNILGSAVNAGAPTVYEELFVADPGDEVVSRLKALLEEGRERERAVERLRRLKEDVLQPGGVERAARCLLSFLEARGLM